MHGNRLTAAFNLHRFFNHAGDMRRFILGSRATRFSLLDTSRYWLAALSGDTAASIAMTASRAL
jgi:hypothetical protein